MKRFLTPLIMLTAGAVLGALSSQYMMETQNVAEPETIDGWTEIKPASDGLRGLYGAGHFLRLGAVPPPKGSRFFVRSEDDDGNSLRGDCVVTVEGKLPQARWWLLNAMSGTKRATLDASEVVRETNGDTHMSLSVSPVPGNWLVPPRNGAYELQMVFHGLGESSTETLKLPRVRRLWC